jgi:uncharacterized protein (DUF58 family)
VSARRTSDPERQQTSAIRLSWTPSVLARRLATVGALAVGMAALAQNTTLVVFAAPVLVALSVWLREQRPGSARIEVVAPTPRTTEHAPVDLLARVDAGEVGSIRLSVRPEPWVETDDRVLVTLGGRAEGRWPLTPTRWGFWGSGSVVTVTTSRHRMWSVTTVTEGPSLTVYPPASAASLVPAPPYLLSRLGPHVSRAPGTGIEFAGVRSYQPGDSARRVNWTLSSRRDELMVNEFAQERMADVVVLIDSMRDLGTPGRTTVDVSVRGATSVVQAYLAHADRVGVVAFGSSLRWLTPTTGVRHFYRIVETLLAARQARTYVDPSVDRLPLAVLPSGALVVCFSPLVDEVAIEAVRDLRERAHPVVVVDVLTEEEIELRGGVDDLALRIWRLERLAVAESLERIGVRVVPYHEVEEGGLHWLRMHGTGARR